MYCTIEDIIWDISYNTVAELVNDENIPLSEIHLIDSESIYSERIKEQIERATEEINGYLRSNFIIPLSPVPALINIICRDLSMYYLYKRRYIPTVPETIKDIYNQRIKQILYIIEGTITLDLNETEQPAFDIISNKTEEDRIFSLSQLQGY